MTDWYHRNVEHFDYYVMSVDVLNQFSAMGVF